MHWKELVRVALLGSDRVEVPEALRQTLDSLGVSTEGDMAVALLEAAAKMQAQRKAGYIPGSWDGDIPTAPDHGDQSYCSPAATRHLQQILDGTYDRALPEFLALARQHQRFLPPEQLPQMLQQATEQPSQIDMIRPLLGAQAHWLIGLHPEWSTLFAEPDMSDWTTAAFPQQLAALLHLRQQDIPESISLLQSIWPQLDHKQKTAFLSALEPTVCSDDEPLLEPALDDRRKEVRTKAAFLLSRIPGSALQERIWQRLEPLIGINGSPKGKIKPMVILPEKITEAMLRDGLDPRRQWTGKIAGGGVKASRLAQMMAVVPPTKWEARFEKTPDELVAIFTRSEYAGLLLEALSRAATLHTDEGWATALLQFWIDHRRQERWTDFNPRALYENATEAVFNAVAPAALQHCIGLPDEESSFYLLTRNNTATWSESLTRTFIKKVKDWINRQGNSFWMGTHLKRILRNAAYCIDPGLTDSLTKGWPTSAPSFEVWMPEVELFFKTLRFRKEMRESLADGETGP